MLNIINSYGNGMYKNTIYPGLQISNGNSTWNESNLWPEWGIYQQNLEFTRETWSYNLTSIELGEFNPPWRVMGWIEDTGQYTKDYFILLPDTTDSDTYDVTVNFTIVVGCTWRGNIDDNIRVCYFSN